MKTGKVIPARHYKHTTGRTASTGGAVPWTGAPGNRREDWVIVEAGWTIAWPDGTTGIGRPPFATKEQAETWADEHPRFPGMSAG